MISAPVVSSAGPLIALEQIGHLELLKQLFGTVPAWIGQQELAQPVGPRILGASLGPGESETISLALETRARLVVLDERPARRLAQALRLPVIGTLGILLAAKQRQLLVSIRPCLDALLEYGFRIAPGLYENVLSAAGEEPGID